MGINLLFDQPFYEGGAVTDDVPFFMPVSLAGHKYLLDLTKYARQTIAPIRPPQDQSDEPGEHSLNQEGLWRRSQSRFHLGQGQEFLDDVDGSVRTRFWQSKGVDVWERRKLRLLHDATQKRASVNTNLKVLKVGSYLYFVDGNEVYHVVDPNAAWSGINLVAANIHVGDTPVPVQSLTTDGSRVYAALGVNGIHQSTAGAAVSTQVIAGTYNFVGYANGRLLAANNDVLSEISPAGVATVVRDHPNSSWVWKALSGSPTAIYVGGTSGDRSIIYALTALDDSGALSPPVVATELPDGETINDLAYYAGAVILATSRGIRIATIGSNNSLSYGPVIEAPGSVLALEGQGEYVWFTWSNYDADSSGLGRLNLSDFTSELVPAYASDLMATAAGLSMSVATYNERRYFAVAGDGFWGETDEYVEEGWIDTGFITYGTVEKKIATSLDMRHEPMPVGASIEATIITEEGDSELIGRSEMDGSLSPPSPLGLEVEGTEAFRLLFNLVRGTDPEETPVLRRYTIYSRVAPVLTDEIIVPLIIHETVLTHQGEGSPYHYKPLEEYEFLNDLASNKAIVRYQEGGASYNVYVTQLKLEPVDWTADRRFFNGIIYARLVTVNVR